MKIVKTLFFLFLVMACKKEQNYTAQQIIDKSIEKSGSHLIGNSEINFMFRDKNYTAKRKNGVFQLSRSFDSITDVLSNKGFVRKINDVIVDLNDTIAHNYANSVNSVHYFSVLPYGLNDKAVRKKLLPSSTLNGKEYYKIEITFSENGGGEDFEDVFIYWVDKQTFLIDYLAYSYHTNGGGKRFRVLKEQCIKNGIRFVDYINYKPIDNDVKLTNLDKAFEQNKLIKVSEIVLKNIDVTLLN